MSEVSRDPAQYLGVWKDVLAHVLEEVSGTACPCVLSSEAPADLSSPSESDLWIVGASVGAVRGEMSFRCSAASTVRLAQIFTSEKPSTTETAPQHREAVLELLRQAGGVAASALKASWGEVQLRLDAFPSAPSWPASLTAWLQLGEDPVTAPVIEMQLSAALVAALRAQPEDTAQPAGAADPGPASPAPAPSPTPNDVNLDLLMDVELAVTLRFGSRRLLLGEILDLTPGAVVDLDRQVQEPVDLLLDDRIVARGEVVVVDGNYGLRITEVAPGVA